MSRMYEHYIDPEEKMLDALAECMGIDKEIVALIDPVVGEDTGSSGEWHYGYYFEFPNLTDLADGIQASIGEQLIAKIPFGETVYFSDAELSNTKADPFYERRDHEAHEAEVYLLKLELPTKYLVGELTRLKALLESSTDELVQKALILAAFSLTESFVRRQVWKVMPNLDVNVKDNKLRKAMEDEYGEKLQHDNRRREIYKTFTGKPLLSLPPYFDDVRNSLAHDIGSGVVNGVSITVEIKKGEERSERSFKMSAIFDELQRYIEKFDK